MATEPSAATKRKLAVFTIVVEVPEGESYESATVYGLETRDEYLMNFVGYDVVEVEVDA